MWRAIGARGTSRAIAASENELLSRKGISWRVARQPPAWRRIAPAGRYPPSRCGRPQAAHQAAARSQRRGNAQPMPHCAAFVGSDECFEGLFDRVMELMRGGRCGRMWVQRYAGERKLRSDAREQLPRAARLQLQRLTSRVRLPALSARRGRCASRRRMCLRALAQSTRPASKRLSRTV